MIRESRKGTKGRKRKISIILHVTCTLDGQDRDMKEIEKKEEKEIEERISLTPSIQLNITSEC